jgi:large subunit ribosomal protein L9
MKVILNKDLSTLGEEGDVKDVAKGYARNYLFPRGIALPYNERTVKLFEERRGGIEERKALKRQDAAGLKEKLEALSLALIMPAGANGKLYGAVTAQTVVDELAKQGFQIERKKIEISGNTIKSVGKYRILVKLYESSAAECSLTVEGQPVKAETRAPAAPQRRGRREFPPASTGEAAPSADAPPPIEGTADSVSAETAAAVTAPQGEAAETAPTAETSPGTADTAPAAE